MVSFECLRIMGVWNQWFYGDAMRCRVCRRLVALWCVAVDLVGFYLLSGDGWMCCGWIAKAAYFVFQPTGWQAAA